MSARQLVGIIVLVAMLCAWAYIALSGEPRLQVGIANGAYANVCCGTVVLDNGIMTVSNERVSYVVEQDKAGPYVLPKTYVGASVSGFVVGPNAHPLKLRLNGINHPRQIELLDDGPSGGAFLFTRTSGS